MRLFAVSSLALTTLATPAFAQEATSPFTGPRAEIVAGWDHAGSYGAGTSGFAYGGAIGYDAQVSSAVIGAEAEITGSTTEEDGVSAGRDLYVGARLGYVVAPSTLIYAKGGYTNARVSIDDDGENFDGYRVGGGIEHNFGRFYGKLEYRYSNYNNLDFSDDFDFEDFEAEDFDTDIDLDRHQVLVGLGMRF